MLATFLAKSQNIVLEFHALHTCKQATLDSIRIENLTQGGEMVLYHPDNTVEFFVTAIGDIDIVEHHLHVSQNYPNPFSSLTFIDVLLASPDKVSLEVHDLKGRVVARYEEQLDAGMHRFSFSSRMSEIFFYSAGRDETYMLSARSGREAQRHIMLQLGVAGTPRSEITYLGKREKDPPMASPKSDDFVFHPGDELRFTGFVTDYAGEMNYGIINDTPEVSTEYWFDIADIPPNKPSEI